MRKASGALAPMGARAAGAIFACAAQICCLPPSQARVNVRILTLRSLTLQAETLADSLGK